MMTPRYCVPVLLSLGILACDASLVPLVPRAIRDAGGDAVVHGDGRTPFSTWGTYAASLAVPGCVGDLVLVVNTTANEQDGGDALSDPAAAGAALSLFEALTIAANRNERVAIFFDETVFPAEQPATIALPFGCTLPVLENGCIDGRGRGVIVDFTGAPGDGLGSCTLTLGDATLAVGLELHRLGWQVDVRQGGQLAGCRVNSDGHESTGSKEPEAVTATSGALIGPGNSIGNTFGVVLKSTGLPTITGNYFGVDPVTGATVSNAVVGVRMNSLFTLSGTLRIEGNTFRGDIGIAIDSSTSADARIEITGNRFEGNDASTLSGRGILARGGYYGRWIIGPGNRFEGLGVAIEMVENNASDSNLVMTRNSITGCGTATAIEGARVQAPTVTRATAALVEGSCVQAGVAEIFGDAQGQAEHFLGQAPCRGDTWRFVGEVASAQVTATLTTKDGTSNLSEPRSVDR